MEMIKDFTDGQHIYTQLLVIACNKCVTSQGRTYLNITLQDSTGTIAGKKWDVFEGDYEVFVEGNVVAIEGEVLKYQNALQLKVVGGSAVPLANVDVTKFIQQAPEPREALEKELHGYIDSLEEGELKDITKYLINKFYDAYVIHPAAVRNHHNFCSGLLYHSISMARVAEQICKIYPHLNRDWVVAGALIHDLGKTIELSGALCTKYTVEGNLVGHISIMVAEIRMAAETLGIEGETLTLLEHMILSHHTKPEYGSPVAPMTREALALAMIDDFDAKMNVVDKAIENADLGGFTDKIFALDSRGYYVPSYEKKNRE